MKRTAPALRLSGALFGAATLLAAVPAHAIDLSMDALLLEGGFTEDRVDANRYGGAFRWELKPQWLQVGDWHLKSLVELSIDYWDAKTGGKTGKDDLFDFGLTPILRYQRDPGHGIAPFIEFGVGVHGHTRTGIENKDFDIPFSFGEHLGLGARFGEGGKYELVYRYQHQSNAGIGDTNPGINFHSVAIGFYF